MGTAYRKFDTFTHIRTQLLLHPEGYSITALVAETGVHIATVSRQLHELGAQRVRHGAYTLEPTEADIALARAVLQRAGE